MTKFPRLSNEEYQQVPGKILDLLERKPGLAVARIRAHLPYGESATRAALRELAECDMAHGVPGRTYKGAPCLYWHPGPALKGKDPAPAIDDESRERCPSDMRQRIRKVYPDKIAKPDPWLWALHRPVTMEAA